MPGSPPFAERWGEAFCAKGASRTVSIPNLNPSWKRKSAAFVKLQESLLNGVLPLLSKGGRIVYSTCTIHPKENSLQVEKFVSLNSRVTLTYQQQIWPDDKTPGDGFFAAVIDSE